MNRKKQIMLHIACWVLMTLTAAARPSFSMTGIGLFADGFYAFLKELPIAAAFCIIDIAAFYGSCRMIGNPLFLQRRYLRAFAGLIILLAALIVLRAVIEFGLLKSLLGYDNYRGRVPSVYFYVTNIILFYTPGFILYGLIYFVARHWFRETQLKQEIVREKLASELALLRSQVNPHFLFNSLNDIYSLSFLELPGTTEALLKLSGLLRYMVDSAGTDLVPLGDEIQYLDDLTDLQRISSKNGACIKSEVCGNTEGLFVAPLLFVAFLENAFKHGVVNDRAAPIKISVNINAQTLHFHCHNMIRIGKKDKAGGVGLANVARRLELLYPNHHKLQIRQTEKYFDVFLELKLDENTLPGN